jgi:hypothetical protein
MAEHRLLEISTGNRVHAGKLSKWKGMRPAHAGDLLGLLLDFQTGTLTLFINGERCGIVWDGMGNKLHFCVELNGLETTPPPQVRLLPPPRAPREQPAPLRAEEPPPVEVKPPRVKSTGTGSEAVGMQTESRTSPMIYDPNPNATTMNYPLAQATGGRATANPSRMAQVAQIFRRFDGDRDRYLNFSEVAALEWEVSRQELSPANYVALCEAVDADQEKGLDEQCLHRFYEMAGVGELHNAYEKLFKAPSNWQSPLAEWAVRDARAVGGLPRIYLSSQPESAFVPEPQKENLHLDDEDWEEPEPKAREVWTQTGFGTPMPRPIVRYGAPKRPANSGRHASIPSRYGKYKPGGGPPKSSDANRNHSTAAVAHGPAWVPGKNNPRKLRAEMPRAVAPRRVIPRREDMDAREYWRQEASKRERLPITNRTGTSHNPEALGSAGAEAGLQKAGGGSSGEVAAVLSTLQGAHSKQTARLDAMQAQLQAAKMAARLQAANAQNSALLEQLNSVSFVGTDLRSALAAPPGTTADWNQQPPHKSGQAPERAHSPAIIPQPLYAGYPNVAQANFRRSLPLDALVARSATSSAARNVGRGEEGEVTEALRRSVDAASLITFGTSGAVKQMY